MKALLVNGSPHPRGCTYTALTELKNTLEAEDIEVELLHVGNKDIRGCIACRKCAQTGKCVFDDVVNEVAPKLAEADAFVICVQRDEEPPVERMLCDTGEERAGMLTRFLYENAVEPNQMPAILRDICGWAVG